MSTKQDNAKYAEALKTLLMLRHEPVAVKLVRKGEAYPGNFAVPAEQKSHCQAVMAAKNGEKLKVPLASQGCMVGASCLGMTKTPEKVASGDFHAGIGIHESPAAAKEMIAERIDVPYETDGEVVCPLKDADFVPDSVIVVDIPERIYWFEGLYTRKNGGRVQYSTAPFQCACEDVTAVPIVTGKPNISIGCFGCRKKTDMKADEMAIGVPYKLIPDMVAGLEVYKGGVFTKAKRD
jgi:uncharacterized protein (DUF169 family)